jgi:orotate phosphoribosyltransferase
MESSQMPQSQDHDRSLLREMLAQKSVHVGESFTLASGAVSDVYIDAKQTTCSPEAMPLIGRAFLHKLEECGWKPKAVGGKTVGADPIAFSIARESIEKSSSSPINAFIVRKEAKKHGMKQFIEGLEDTDGLQVVIVDDVCTKGGSTGDAIEKARKVGMKVLGAICLVDREEGATEFLAKYYDCQLASIFKKSELLDVSHHGQSSAIAVPDPVGALRT